MAVSQNGWAVATKADCDQGPFQGVKFPNGILAGDVATIARWQLMRYETLVEPLKAGSCWGWFDRAIRGATTKSNHASATAWDINADKYPLGAEPGEVMSAKKIAACDQIVAESGGVLRWGGRYNGRKDVMHWEINCSRTKAAAFAAKIRSGNAPGLEETVDVADVRDIWTTDGIVATPSNASDFKAADGNPVNPYRTPAQSLTNIEYHVRALESALAAQGKVLAGLATRDTVDEQALAAALAPLLAPLLPTGTTVSSAAIVEAFRQMAGAQ